MTATDLVFVLPGITGSTLHVDGAPVWELSGRALLSGLRTLGRSIKRLQLPVGIGDEHPGDGVSAISLMPCAHWLPGKSSPMHGYTELLNRLSRLAAGGAVGKVVPVPYDWRLSNRYNGWRLAHIVETELGRWRDSDPSRATAHAVFVCHSMGGLVARWYIEKCGGAEITRKLITIGTPYRGAARTIDEVVNGATRRIGPLALDLTDFARSLPSTYQLLPDYACIDDPAGLRRLDEAALPGLDTVMLEDALIFYRELAAAEDARPASGDATHAIIGIRQHTGSTVRHDLRGTELLETIQGEAFYGDGTVPIPGALKRGVPHDAKDIYRIVELHGSLQSNHVVLDQIEEILTGQPIKFRRAASCPVRIRVPEITGAGEDLVVIADIDPDALGRTPAIRVALTPAETSVRAKPVSHVPQIVTEGRAETCFRPEYPGIYDVQITGLATGSGITPVTAATMVWPPDFDD